MRVISYEGDIERADMGYEWEALEEVVLLKC
jgi:hypothetical protein